MEKNDGKNWILTSKPVASRKFFKHLNKNIQLLGTDCKSARASSGYNNFN